MALVTKTFSDIITFSRASTGTFFNSSGVLTSAGNNVPRFDYNPATLAAQGLLIEEQRTNLLTYSEQFDNVIWTKTRSSITANTTTAPDGTTTADKLVEDTTASSSHLMQGNALGSPPATSTWSVFLKAAERNWAALQLNGDVSGFAYFDLTNGVVGTVSNVTAAITSVGNGWYRCSVTRSGYTASVFGQIFLATGDNTASYTGNGTSGIFIWGAQLEAGAFPTSYIPTTTTALTRSADVASVNTLAPWFNSTASTLYAEWTNLAAAMAPAFQTVVVIDDASLNNIYRIFQVQAANAKASQNMISGGVSAGRIDAGGAYSNATVKSAAAFAALDRAIAVNGQSAVTSATGALPVSVTQMSLGNTSSTTTNFLNGYLRRIVYYPTRLSNAQLQALTA